MKSIKEHKAQIGGLVAIISTLVTVGILIAAGFFIIQKFLEEDEFTNTAGAVSNETGLHINTTVATVDQEPIAYGFNSFAVSACYANATGGGLLTAANVTIIAANYTIDADAGTITDATAGAENYTDVQCTYTYLYGESSYVGVNDTLIAMGTIPDLLGLIILIAVIGIILAVIFNVVPGARVSGA